MYGWLQRLFSQPEAAPVARRAAPAEEPAAPAMPAAAEPEPEPAPVVAAPKASNISWLQRSDINATFTNWLFDGNGHPDIFTSRTEQDILAGLEKIVQSKQSGANLVRRMPGVIPQLLQSLRTDDFSGAELARKLSHDVVLVAAVIRIANSSVYNPGQPITSIEHAVLVLGQNGLRQLITSVAFRPIIDLQSGHFTKTIAPRLWEQGEKCALVNRMLATDQRIDPFEAFLAGLLQNVGMIVALRVLDQLSEGRRHGIGSENFCNALIAHGRTLSCNIGAEWKFPASVSQAIMEQANAGKKTDLSPMGEILSTGDYLSKMYLLSKNERLQGDLANYTSDLSERETDFLAELNSAPEEDENLS